MKAVVTISLLFLYLASITEAHEVFKIPVLLEHFNEHRKENLDLSFWGFLHQHYGIGDLKDADYDKDMKLPFKSHPELAFTASLIAVVPVFENQVVKITFGKEKKSFYQNDSLLISDFRGGIWQPPKFC
ncbi:MAG: hypothetical protein JJE09_16430 [Bacteroidia bacterium]|nr:hypothetical protein [Bacteroidia bacterium]